MTTERYPQGLLDTNIMILRKWINPMELPAEMAISAITLAELSAGPHQVRPHDEHSQYDENEPGGWTCSSVPRTSSTPSRSTRRLLGSTAG